MTEPTVEPWAVTPKFAWRVPVLGDVPNVPSDITNLALDIEGTLGKTQRGIVTMSSYGAVGAGSGAYLAVTFSPAFAVAPTVVLVTYRHTLTGTHGAYMATAPAEAAVTANVSTISATGFGCWVRWPLALTSTTGHYLQWIAQAI